MALEINLLKSKMVYKADVLTQVHGSIKWLVVFADGYHTYLYKIMTGSSLQYCGSGGGYMKNTQYIYLAMNTETHKYEPVQHLQRALQSYESVHGAAVFAQSLAVSESMKTQWGAQ